MKNSVRGSVRAGILAVWIAMPAMAQAETVAVYCGAQEDWCQEMANAFTKETGIEVAMTRKSGGEFLAQIKAEAKNPKGDVWWGGTGDPHLQAAEDDLTEAYRSPMLSELHPWAQIPA